MDKPPPKRRQKSIYNHACENCGIEFQCNQKNALYCSPECKDLARKTRYNKNNILKANLKWLRS